MKLKIKPENCIKCCFCVEDFPELFEIKNNVAVTKTEEVIGKMEEDARYAKSNCLGLAIVINNTEQDLCQ